LSSLETSLATEVSKQAISALKDYLGRWKVDVTSSQERLQSAINEHQRDVRRWSEEISFKDLLKPRVTSDVFVPLNIYLLPRRQRISPEEQLDSVPLAEILKNKAVTHLTILGQPGAGKTTSVKHLCQEMLTNSEVFPSQDFPLLIRLRDLNAARSSDADVEDLLIERIQS